LDASILHAVNKSDSFVRAIYGISICTDKIDASTARKASAWLKSLGVDLTEYDVEKDPEKLKEYLERSL
jgi:hypothetical protein